MPVRISTVLFPLHRIKAHLIRTLYGSYTYNMKKTLVMRIMWYNNTEIIRIYPVIFLLQIHKIYCLFRIILLFYTTTRMEAIVMHLNQFPVIDLPATGANIRRLRQSKGLSVRDLQQFFGFEEPQAIYKWQRGQSLPTVDNLYALSALLDVPMNDILVAADLPELHICTMSGRPKPAAHLFCPRARGAWQNFKAA